MEGLTTLAVRIPDAEYRILDNLAKKTGRTKTYYVQELLSEHLAEMEDVYLAEKRAEDVKAGRTKTYSLDEVIKENGLSDKI
jgi:RHH-type rel operon transcriptional repressor/antitoxin RelB